MVSTLPSLSLGEIRRVAGTMDPRAFGRAVTAASLYPFNATLAQVAQTISEWDVPMLAIAVGVTLVGHDDPYRERQERLLSRIPIGDVATMIVAGSRTCPTCDGTGADVYETGRDVFSSMRNQWEPQMSVRACGTCHETGIVAAIEETDDED